MVDALRTERRSGAGTRSRDAGAPRLTKLIMRPVVGAVLLVCMGSWASEIEQGVSWHVKEAELRFRIEQDPHHAGVPDVCLSELKADKGPSDLRRPKAEGKWSGKYCRLSGKLYKEGVTISAPTTVVYKNQQEYGRFVALIGVSDRADSDASVRFEVWADRRRLYESGPLTKLTQPTPINVRIPSGSEELKLVTDGTNVKNRRWAIWVNAGLLLKGENRDVSCVEVYTPGYDPTDLYALVFTSAGERVNSRVLSAWQGGPMEILFDSSDGRPVYFVYLVPKDKYSGKPASWEPKAGLTLETRRTDKSHRECQKLPDLLRVWDKAATPVGRSLVDSIHHGFPIHRVPREGSGSAAGKGGLALYRYEGFFRVKKAGQYSFATASNWGSYLLVDGKPVVTWPGQHDYRGGIRGQKKGQTALKPGVHKLEYLNYSPWGRMFTLAAWQPPQGKMSVMAGSDFLPVRRYAASAVAHREPARASGSFEWRTVDDWRLNHEETALVKMRFGVIPPEHPGDYSYRWRFDDGNTGAGESIEHIFLRPGMRTVTLQAFQGQEPLASPGEMTAVRPISRGELTQKVQAHTLSEKIYLEPGDTRTYEETIAQTELGGLPIGDLVNLYTFADGMDRPQWKQRAVAALTKRVDELVAESEYGDFCIELGEYLRSAPIQQYDQALRLLSLLGKKSTQSARVQQRAILAQAGLLIQCFGKGGEALAMLNPLNKKTYVDKETGRRVGLSKAEGLVALGDIEGARNALEDLGTGSEQASGTKQQLRHMGMLRHAGLLAENTDDPVQLDYAMEEVGTVLAQDPAQILTPTLNLVRLDIHLARKEYQIAFHLAERLKRLDFSDYYRLETLVRQVKALCGMKAIEQAKALGETMAREYPYSPAVAETKKAIVEAVMAQQSQ
jgi:hypothetical protein